MKASLSFKAVLAGAALIAATLTPVTAANANLRMPAGAWPVCSESRVTYCVESVSILVIGGSGEENLVWVPNGQAGPETVGETDPTTLPPAGEEGELDLGAPVTTVAGATTQGRWTSPSWIANGYDFYGYEGLNISIAKANRFTNHLFFTVQPVKVDSSNATRVAMSSVNNRFLADLNEDMRVSMRVRTGDAITGVLVGFAIGTSSTTGANNLTFRGYPVITPKVSNARQCTGETGKSDHEVVGIQGFVVVENDDMGFGVEGLSGRMIVASNGQCATSTPVWDSRSETMTWQVGAPHFDSKGETNKGFYRAVIPANDALLMWGLTDPNRAASALVVSVVEETGGPAVAASKVSVRNGNIIIDVSGFTFSKPKITIAKSKKANVKRFFTNKKTVRCYDAKAKKTITKRGVYGCPAGTRQR